MRIQFQVQGANRAELEGTVLETLESYLGRKVVLASNPVVSRDCWEVSDQYFQQALTVRGKLMSDQAWHWTADVDIVL